MYPSQNLALPIHPTRRHPLTGQPLRAVGVRRDGRLIWPIMGGSEGAPEGGAPAASAVDPAPAAPGAPAPAAAPEATPPAGETPPGAAAEKVEDLPDWAQKTIKDLRKESGDRRTQATQAEQRQQEIVRAFAKAAGIDLPGGEAEQPDPAQLAQQVAAAQQAQRDSAAELVVWRNHTTLGVDPQAVTDSRAFANAIANLDPTDAPAFEEAVKKAAQAAAETNPKLKAGRAPGASSVDHGAGGPGNDGAPRTPKPLSDAVSGHYGA